MQKPVFKLPGNLHYIGIQYLVKFKPSTIVCSPSLTLQGLVCVKAHLESDSTAQEEVLNINTGGSSFARCSSSPPQSPNSTSSETSCPSPRHAVVPSFENHLQPYKRKKTPLILKRQARWQEKTAGLLFRKAGAVYHSLACLFNSNGKFGRGLKNCKLAFKCFEASRVFSAQSDVKQGNEKFCFFNPTKGAFFRTFLLIPVPI